MRGSIKKALKIALFLLIAAPWFVGADVKLRVYLKDGSLQSGNMVSESADKFILVTKEGRVEIPKSDIMFVNGKTLAQWNARPDKNYSTEILPSELPDRGFVNEKATLPPPVKLPPITKSITPPPTAAPPNEPVAAPVAPSKPAEVAPVVQSKQVEAKPAPVESKPVEAKALEPKVEPVAVSEAPPVRPRKRGKSKPVVETAAAVAVAPAKVEEPQTSTPRSVPIRAGRFDREGYAVNHYNLGMQYLSEGERGRGVQELHIAHTLNKWDEKTAFELGKFYKEEGIRPRARKYLDLPALRKKTEVQTLVADMDKADARRDRQPFVNAGIVLSWVILPLLSVALFRRMTQHKLPPPLVVTSENIEQVAEALEEAEPLPTIIPSGELPMAEPLMSTPEPEAPAKSVSPFDDVFKLDKPEPPAPKPFIQQPPIKWPSKPLEPIRMQPAKPPEPMPPVEPIKPPEPVRMEPLKPPEPIYVQPPKPPEPIKPPELEPVAAAPAPVAPARPFERILETERVVSESLVRGNQFAAEGNIEMARREYRTAAALSTVSVDAQLGLAYLCFLQEQWDLSMQHYLNAIQINPRSADAHYGLGRVLMELNRVNDAIPELRKALELDPTLFDAQETLTSLGQLA